MSKFNIIEHVRNILGVTNSVETSSSSSAVFTVEDFKAIIPTLPPFIKAPYVTAWVMSTLPNPVTKEIVPLLHIDVSLDKRGTWKDNKLEHSRYYKFYVSDSGVLYRLTVTNAWVKLGKCSSGTDIIKKINKLISVEIKSIDKEQASDSGKIVFSKQDLISLSNKINDYYDVKVKIIKETTGVHALFISDRIADLYVFYVLDQYGEATMKINKQMIPSFKGRKLFKIEDNFQAFKKEIESFINEKASYEEWEKLPVSKEPWHTLPKRSADYLMDYLVTKAYTGGLDIDAMFDKLKATFKTWKKPDPEDKIASAEYTMIEAVSNLWPKRKDYYSYNMPKEFIKKCEDHLKRLRIPKSLWSFTPKQSKPKEIAGVLKLTPANLPHETKKESLEIATDYVLHKNPDYYFENIGYDKSVFSDFEIRKDSSVGPGYYIFGRNSEKYGKDLKGKGTYVKLVAYRKKEYARNYNGHRYIGWGSKKEAEVILKAINSKYSIKE